MYEMGLREMLALYRVVASKRLMRYRGGENGYTDQFEQSMCKTLGVEHTLAMNSGTSALIAAMAGLEIGPGDEVIIPAYTWIATAMAPLAVGAVPILADVDDSLTIDPADIERKITSNTRAIIPVHMANLPCDMDRIMALAKKHDLAIVEDASQAVGGIYKGRSLGTIGDVGVFSFNNFKNISAGEGGALLTNNERVYRRAMMFHDVGAWTRSHMAGTNEPFFAAMNFRISELTGAVLFEQGKRLDGIISRLRRRRAIIIDEMSKFGEPRLAPHHDSDNATSLFLSFDDAEEAAYVAQRVSRASRPIDSGRHVYTNWSIILEKQSFHERMSPYNWANRDVTYSLDMCAATLDVLSRSCQIDVPYRIPEALLRQRVRKMMREVGHEICKN